MTKKEKVMNFCINYKTTFQCMDFLEACQNNYNAAKSNSYDFMGCPQSYGLPDAEEICNKDELVSCEECWKLALVENKED